MISFVFTATFVSSLLLVHVTSFRSYLSEIPNGEGVPDPCNRKNPWPGVGHMNPKGGGQRNPFGRMFSENGRSWTGLVCDSDSDGDGMTNGAELGDPDCEWVKGQTPRRTTNITHPGVCEPLDSEHCRAKNKWLSCPEEADPFCPALSQPDVKYMDFKLDKTRVPSNKTTWRCQILPWTEEGDFHVIGSKPLVDNADVTHHMIIFGCSGDVVPREGPYPCKMVPDRQCQDILLTWTMGSVGECLHKSEGFRMGNSGYKYIALQIHWNNPQQRGDYVDGSGLRAFYTPRLRNSDSVIMVVGQRYLELPPNSPEVVVNSTCPAFCTQNMFKQPIFITRAVNHMHRLGRQQNVALYREGRFLQFLTNDQVYDYDSPKFYRFDNPIEVLPGDEIRTTCTYSSMGVNNTTFYGESIKDEMCYTFLTYFPHQKSYTQYCTTFKNTLLCKRYLPSLKGNYEGCSWKPFILGKDATAVELTKEIMTECGNKSSCSRACATALDKITQHPCMRGDISGYVSEKWPMKGPFRAYQKMCSEGVVSSPSGTDAKISDPRGIGCTPLPSTPAVLFTIFLYFSLHISLH